jgi:catechol 2,3-dioxygenase-like lactoylglutathione lyase family enzyme
LDILVAIDALDDALHRALPVPMTDQVRLRPERLRELVDDVRSTWPPSAPGALLDELQALVDGARPVPFLSSQVRVDREDVYDLVDRIRAELPQSAFRERLRMSAGVPAPALQHVAVEVRRGDVSAEVAFWALLGFAQTTPPGNLGARSAWVERAGTQIHLMFRDDPVAPPEGHVAVVAEDYGATLQGLRAAGFAPEPREEHWGSPRCFVRSPAGHRVEVMAHAPGAGA